MADVVLHVAQGGDGVQGERDRRMAKGTTSMTIRERAVSQAKAVNPRGDVVGTSRDSVGRSRAFLWKQGSGIVDQFGKRIARLGGEDGPGLEIGKFLAPHGVARDSRGDIYVGEVGVTNWKTDFPDTPMPAVVRCLQKLEKIA